MVSQRGNCAVSQRMPSLPPPSKIRNFTLGNRLMTVSSCLGTFERVLRPPVAIETPAMPVFGVLEREGSSATRAGCRAGEKEPVMYESPMMAASVERSLRQGPLVAGAPPDPGGAPPDPGGAPPDPGGVPPDPVGAPPVSVGAPPDP